MPRCRNYIKKMDDLQTNVLEELQDALQKQSERTMLLDLALKLAQNYASTKDIKRLVELKDILNIENNTDKSKIKEVETKESNRRITRATVAKQKAILNQLEKQNNNKLEIKNEISSTNIPLRKICDTNIKVEANLHTSTKLIKRGNKKQTHTKKIVPTSTANISDRNSDVLLEKPNISIVDLVDEDKTVENLLKPALLTRINTRTQVREASKRPRSPSEDKKTKTITNEIKRRKFSVHIEKKNYKDALNKVEVPSLQKRNKFSANAVVMLTPLSKNVLRNHIKGGKSKAGISLINKTRAIEKFSTPSDKEIPRNANETVVKDTKTVTSAFNDKNLNATFAKNPNATAEKKDNKMKDLLTNTQKSSYTTPKMPKQNISSCTTIKKIRHPSPFNDSAPVTLSAMKTSAKRLQEPKHIQKEKQIDAQKKKEAVLHAQLEEKRLKKEEKELNAKLTREKMEKEKQKIKEAQQFKGQKAQKLFQNKVEHNQMLKKEEDDKKELSKKLCQDQQEKQIDLQKEEEMEKQIPKPKASPTPIYMKEKPPLLPTYDRGESDNEDANEIFDIPRPAWTQNEIVLGILKCQQFIDERLKNTLFCMRPQTPNLQYIFKNINPDRLRRNDSTCIWHSFPRFSLMGDNDDC